MRWRRIALCLSLLALTGQVPLNTPRSAPPPAHAPGAGQPPAGIPSNRAPLPEERQRVEWIPELSADLLSRAPLVTLDLLRPQGSLVKIWRGVAPNLANAFALPSGWQTIGARFAASDAPLLRIMPLAGAGVLTTDENGAPIMNWTKPDALLEAGAKAGTRFILTLTPPGNLTSEAWQSLVASVAKRYGSDPKFGVARWDFAATSEGAQRWYADFARSVRTVAPEAPVGFSLLNGEPITDLAAVAELIAQTGAPLDSLSWRHSGPPEELLRTIAALRARIGKQTARRGIALLPELNVSGANASPTTLTRLYRLLVEENRPNVPLPLLGALASYDGLTTPQEQPTPAAGTLTLLNRLAGVRLTTISSVREIRCMALRSPAGLSMLLWREGEAALAPALPALLRLKGWNRPPQTTYRLTLWSVMSPETPLAQTDVPAGQGDLDIPFALPSGQVYLLELKQNRTPPPIAISLYTKSYLGYGGDSRDMVISVRNTTRAAQSVELEVSGSLPGMVSAAIRRISVGTLASGQGKAYAYRVAPPDMGADTIGYVTVCANGESYGAMALRVMPALVAELVTPRLDMPGPATRAKVEVRLTNRARAPISLTLQTDRTEGEAFTLPGGGKTYTRPVELVAPSGDPGLYPVEVEVLQNDQPKARLSVLVGVPASCRYAAVAPSIDGQMSEWADAEPLGMGRREQAQGRAWRGPGDLSAIAYTKWDEMYLYFACAVTDDVFQSGKNPTELARGDSVQLGFSMLLSTPVERVGYAPGDHEFGMALLENTRPTLWRLAAPPEKPGLVPGAKIAIRRIGNRTTYEAAIPWSALRPFRPKPDALCRISILVRDEDGEGRAWMEWGGGMAAEKRPGLFPTLRLVR
jgi:hypothetical protein